MSQDSSDKHRASPPNEVPSEVDTKETLGTFLKRARRSQHKSLEEAAEATRIHAPTLRALEEDDHRKLPAEVFVRGFIKIYAQYLGLDPHEALKWYHHVDTAKAISAGEKINAQEVLSSESLAESPKFFTGTKIVIILLLLFLGIGGYMVLQKDLVRSPALTEQPASPLEPEKEQASKAVAPPIGSLERETVQDTAPAAVEAPPQPTKQTKSEVKPQPAPELAPKEEAVQTQKPAATAAHPVGEEDIAPDSAVQPDTEEPAAEPQQQPEAAAPAILQPTTAESGKPEAEAAADQEQSADTAKYTLTIRFTEETWLRVELDGKRPQEYTFQPGDTFTWTADDNIDLFLGNAGGAELTLNGETLPVLGKTGKPKRFSIPKDLSP